MRKNLLRILPIILYLSISLINSNLFAQSMSDFDDSLYVYSEEATTIYGVPKVNVVDEQAQLTNQNEITKLLQYPDKAKEKKVEGFVVLRFIINSKGNVNNVELVKGLNDELNLVALTAVKQMKYKPALKNGLPVPVIISMPVRFKI